MRPYTLSMSNDVILTDAKGRPFEKPVPSDFPDTTSFLRAYSAYKDAISECANRAFDAELRKRVRSSKVTARR